MEHRIEVELLGSSQYPSMDVHQGLETNHTAGIERDVYVMVAAQYISLARMFIDERLAAISAEKGRPLNREKLQLWATKLSQLEKHGELNLTVKVAVVKARECLVSIHPELFQTDL
ncbi:hypothetical protein H109_04706 [Trichophyton interdigitale MR816]|uniref:Uncharacterized protein n=1 Tax=Trichophyton interdigitale (strain MR816) TaxID=1215338 RepID=A0A059J6B1_TRIIM|nr:hypothetical protein H101_04951 [Trichophyton interdigitale H6]KDB23421.1 hypothetical protein H109_04706 [Trichophyton interdigitale MR816]